MTEQHKRAFKGVWICKEVWESTEITWMEKCLLAEVDSLDDGSGCFASNAYLAEKFDSTPSSIANQLSKLRKLGMLETLTVANEQRRMRMNPAFTMRLSPPSLHSEPPINPVVNHRTKVENKEEIDTPISPQGGGEVEKIVPAKVLKEAKSKLPTTEPAIRIAQLFSRKLTTEWDRKEIKAFREIGVIDLDDLTMVEAYYVSERAKGADGVHRRDLKTFLNNFLGELDRARTWQQNPKLHGTRTNPSRNGNTDRNAGTLNEGKAALYRGIKYRGRPRSAEDEAALNGETVE